MASEIHDNFFTGDRQKQNISSEAEVFVFPASFAQQRLWFLDQFSPENPFYNVVTALRLIGSLNLTALEQTFNEIVRRHETLRTTFAAVSGQPMQIISPVGQINFQILELQHLPPEQRQTEAQKITAAESLRPFNLSTGPLMRVTILRLTETKHILLLNMHHIASDDWSIGVLIREIEAIYTALIDRQPSPLPELLLQYADFAEWQREWLQGEVLETQLAYWRQQLRGISVLNLPTDRLAPPRQNYRGKTQYLELPKQLKDALVGLSQREGATLFMTLLAAFQTLLYRYSQQTDIVVGSPIANRNRSEIEALIGFFVNTLVLRTNCSGNPTFRDFLSRVREVTLGAYAHQDLPFEKLVEELHPERSLNRHPLFQVVFGLQNAPVDELELPGLKLSSFHLETQTTRFDLELHLWEAEDKFRSRYGEKWKDSEGLRGVAVYNTDLFDEVTIARMLRHFKTLLESIVANPEQGIANLPLLSEHEVNQLLIEWNDTRTDYPQNKCIHQLFEERAQQHPEAVAVTFEGQHLTYRELNSKANQLAGYLQKQGVGAEVLVGLCAERSIDLIVGMLAVLKAGGAYLPLDPSYPRDRLNLMLEDAGVKVLLIQDKLIENFRDFSNSVIKCDRDSEQIAKESTENLTNKVTADNLAYVIYTSGSTGKPKGVAVTHKAVNRLVLNTNYIKIEPGDKIAQASNASFDAATFEIWGALLNGAQLVGISTNITLSPHDLALELRQQQITILFLTTALFQQIARILPQAFNSLRCLLFGGETADIRWGKKVLKQNPTTQLIHVYGPTENTTFSAYYCVQDVPETATSIPIGRPIANTQIYLLDADLQPVAIGVAGQLYLGGDGLARGYLNRPDLTAAAFIPHPFSNKSGSSLYNTGDLGRYLTDGNIEFLGRIDDQVKIRGYRIELGEIEAALCQHRQVREAAVIVREDIPDDKHLVAYVVTDDINEKAEIDNLKSSELRQFLKQKLPGYMVPATYAVLESLPLTPNGKVDRRALPNIDTDNEDLTENYVAPRTDLEEMLGKIWAKVLGKQQVSIYDNFFELGGHSLLATQLISRIRDALQVELPVSNLFEAPTVASLAKYIETMRWAAKGLDAPRTDEKEREDVEF
ncbi:amino acid adenylation domain-containing protein [Tychonema sp. LEGE 07199]|uniref:non-ribosomal peptide synthetase n=1 Tax=unclassified Tychonema TaxID=2642144 RepID=UPI0018822ABA|nr:MULTISPECIES: non-ribosomal peptide synthetase [unclassified Tychonema]MBE9120010.1 amino acid adenylation domain-containing protein [Tychonema sp. LEGE 07199]MBE9132034.1 amino acid adenylation domain-containing protein [Tychonema sp. LEGE 07196]